MPNLHEYTIFHNSHIIHSVSYIILCTTHDVSRLQFNLRNPEAHSTDTDLPMAMHFALQVMPPTKLKLPAKPTGNSAEPGGYPFDFDRVWRVDSQVASKQVFDVLALPVMERFCQVRDTGVAATSLFSRSLQNAYLYPVEAGLFSPARC